MRTFNYKTEGSGQVDPFGPSNPYLIGSDAQQSGLDGETLYAAFAMDGLGCMGGETFILERPKGGSTPEPAWGLYGNDANGNTPPPTPPQGGGEPAPEPWLGTNDSTDVVMKANNQAQLRLGADGVTEVMQQMRMSNLQEHVPDTLLPSPRILLLQEDGTVTASPALGSGNGFFPWEPPRGPECLMAGTGQYVEYWTYQPNKIYVQCPQVNVGIGTNNPIAKLDVRGQTYTQTLSVNTYAQDAKVTIKGGQPGTQNQFKALEVQDTDGSPALRVFNDGKVVAGAPLSQIGDRASIYLGDANHSISSIWGEGLSFSTMNAPDAMVIEQGTGKVQIGPEKVSSGPHANYRLSVDGKLVAREMVVTTDENYWSDFVFEKDYHLRPLSDVEAFIAKNGHLPDVPSAKEVTENGQDLGRMDAILLRKIEELTLYIIELEKRLNDKNGEK